TDLISHVAFLLEADWRIPKRQQSMWVFTQEGQLYRSSQVYIASEQPYSASQMVTTCEQTPDFHFLHSEYSDRCDLSSGEDRKECLQTYLVISSRPRLSDSTDTESIACS